jgi:hypothetical protein
MRLLFLSGFSLPSVDASDGLFHEIETPAFESRLRFAGKSLKVSSAVCVAHQRIEVLGGAAPSLLVVFVDSAEPGYGARGCSP